MPTRTLMGTTLHYDEAGPGGQGGQAGHAGHAAQGSPLVLLHGFPLDSRVWAKQREGLADRFRVITPDLRGFGKSTSADRFSMESLADDVHALLEAIGALPAVLGGLSMGGYVALEYARKYPADLKGLILVDTKAEGDTAEGKEGRNKMIELVRAQGSSAVAEQMMPKMLAPETPATRPQVARELRSIMENCPALTIEHALVAMRDRIDHTANLPSIAVPTLMIVGAEDAITPPKVAQAMQSAIPRSQLAVIPDAGHMAVMEQPEQVNRTIANFVPHS